MTTSSDTAPVLGAALRTNAAPVGTGAYLLLVFGIFCCAVSVILIKSSTADPYWLSGWRLVIAAFFLTPMVLPEWKRDRTAISWRSIGMAVPGAVLLSVHFITWATGARMTTAVNGSLIVNLSTAVLPFVMWLLNGERINRGEIIGTLVALSGVAVLCVTNFQVSADHVWGDLICFGSMVLFCFYIGFARRNAAGRNLWLYLVPLYWMAGAICMAVALAAGKPAPPATYREIVLLIALGLVPTVMGHSIVNWCIRIMRGQIVSTVNLTQFLFAGVIGYFLLGETPSMVFYPVCAMILLGSVIVIRSNRTTVDVDAES